MPNSDQRFSAQDIRSILKRATEIQGEHTGVLSSSSGSEETLTLSELTRIATDSGIPEEVLVQSVREYVVSQDESRQSKDAAIEESFISTTHAREFRIPGRLNSRQIEDVLSILRRTTGDPGQVQATNDTSEWQTASQTRGKVFFRANCFDDVTTVRLEWSEPTLKVPFFVVATVLSVIAIPIIFESLGLVSFVGAMLFLMIVSALLMGAHMTSSALIRNRKRGIDTLFDTIRKTIVQAALPRQPDELHTGRESAPGAKTDILGDFDSYDREARPLFDEKDHLKSG